MVMDFNITKQSNWTYYENEAAVRENIYEIAKELVTKALEKQQIGFKSQKQKL